MWITFPQCLWFAILHNPRYWDLEEITIFLEKPVDIYRKPWYNNEAVLREAVRKRKVSEKKMKKFLTKALECGNIVKLTLRESKQDLEN